MAMGDISFLQGVLLLAVLAVMTVALVPYVPTWFGYVAAVLMASYYLGAMVVFGPSWPRAGLVVIAGTTAVAVWWRGLRGSARGHRQDRMRDN
jgi:hypothetical protein